MVAVALIAEKHWRMLNLSLVCVLGVASVAGADQTPIRLGGDLQIVETYATGQPVEPAPTAAPTTVLAESTLLRPRLVGFSPLVAIATSDERLTGDGQYEHQEESSFVGTPLNAPVSSNFVIGILDSGSDVNLTAGAAGDVLGFGPDYITGNTLPLGGASGTIEADILWPAAYFAAGIDAIDGSGALDTTQLRGHSNVCGLVAPPIVCNGVEAVSAILGMPFISLFNHVINVDQPVEVLVNGEIRKSPRVSIQSKSAPVPTYAHAIPIEFGGLAPATTANYYPDFIDLETPLFPTLMSSSPLSIPFGGLFFTELSVREGPASVDNFPTQIRVMVDTGAQSSVISPGVAAQLSLPLEPDFEVEVCGIGGTTLVPGYYIDFVRIAALGGALEYGQAPFVVLDLASPEGGSLDGILGMNFFYDRNVILEPGLTTSAFLQVSAPLDVSFADNDVDFDVDMTDAEFFLNCMTPTQQDAVRPECRHFDTDDDGDVDLIDFARFELAFTGPQ